MEAYLYLTMGLLIFWQQARIERRLRDLNKTLANAVLANLNANLASSGGGMHFKRLSERAREDTSGQEEGQPAA